MTSLLECHDVSFGYGLQVVVRGVTMRVGEGELVALVGPNGSGKTTLLNGIGGFISRRSGLLRVLGEEVKTARPDHLSRRGVGVVDARSLFMSLTVAENLQVACNAKRRDLPFEFVFSYFPHLESRLDLQAGQLSGGEQQMLALARSIIRRPRLLLIDEISMGLAPLIVDQIFPQLRRIAADTGTAVLMVEQHVRLALEATDRALVLVQGEIMLDRASTALLGDDAESLETAFLGSRYIADEK